MTSDNHDPDDILTPEQIGRIVRHMDVLADRLLSDAAPDVGTYRALAGWVAWANGSRVFTPSPMHQHALRCLPLDTDAWMAQERRMRGA